MNLCVAAQTGDDHEDRVHQEFRGPEQRCSAGRDEQAGPGRCGSRAHSHPECACPAGQGTLTQLTTLLGTPWALEVPRGAILLLEDVSERPYRIHRLLLQLAQSGVLARAGAIVFGEFRGCDEPGGPPAIRDVLREFTRGFPGPVLFGLPFGHSSAPSLSIPIGVTGRVVTSPAGLVIEEAAVE